MRTDTVQGESTVLAVANVGVTWRRCLVRRSRGPVTRDILGTRPGQVRTGETGDRRVKRIEGLSEDEERAAAMFRALGNPARVRIVTTLAEQTACVTGDFVEMLPLAQSTVSQHLKVLKEAGIVRGEIDGEPCYCLDPTALDWLVRFCAGMRGTRDACAEAEPAEAAGAV